MYIYIYFYIIIPYAMYGSLKDNPTLFIIQKAIDHKECLNHY